MSAKPSTPPRLMVKTDATCSSYLKLSVRFELFLETIDLQIRPYGQHVDIIDIERILKLNPRSLNT